MATHDSLFRDDDVRRTDDGLAVSLQIPWYRSLWLSAVDDVAATVNGVEVATEDLRFVLEGREYRIEEPPRAVGHPLVRRRAPRCPDPPR
ncbi:DUF6379 domain-containing protein [Microbacterium sp. ET2]|uniref:C-glycoside deglycosidase beta subunit domain-containing protein n=1 Tax=Microbacterium albipurpureum TaxID=3050384 RepID=UPI00259C6E90|nr:DUF6379 domain-containing protein [Microbacterium sp. ET2 (Ac-2212)]WJL94458.1 DUF6379 domain-containing protein [Microbacterium sp. ET2 (Ac-2212)]